MPTTTTPTPTPSPASTTTDEPTRPPDGPLFAIAGGVDGLLPGQWSMIRVTVSNPTTESLRITSITVTVAADSAPPGCPSAANIRLVQSSVSAAAPLTVPAGGSMTLVDAPQAPQIILLDLPDVNQDACQGASFALSYSGTAEW